MPLSAGTRLGPYEIQRLVGSGGMGEVYRARDTRLQRDVAIKVLPPHLKDDSDLRQRFEREAQTIAALEHPHICVLHDISRQDGVDFLVMEYLDGETLETRLARGPLPLEQVLRYAMEIADALEKAHRQGVTHRDLKPGNIMLTKGGVKLLDFGLAKLRPAPAAAGAATAFTQPGPLTGQGSILGTLQYMAPEQLEGAEADARADIFAFGAIVYEMATGRRAFEGKSQASLIAAILDHEPPPIATLQPLTPAALELLVGRCLAKHPDERWQSVHDVLIALKWIAEAHPDTASTAIGGAATRLRFRERVQLGALALLAGGLLSGLLIWTLAPAERATSELMRVAVPIADADPKPVLNQAIALSPDGRRIVYVGDTPGRELHVRRLDEATAAAIPGTGGAAEPFFSPDGQSVGYVAGRKLRTVPLVGGTPRILADAPNPRGAVWAPDDSIVFAPEYETGLWRIPAGGGTPMALTQPDRSRAEKTHRLPEALPDGSAILFTVGLADITSFDDARIEALSLKTGERRVIVQGGSQPRFSPTGHLLYARAGSVYAAPFDPGALEVTGPAVPLLDGVTMEPGIGRAMYSLTGRTLVYVPGGPLELNFRLLLYRRDGSSEPLLDESRPFLRWSRMSPDGKRVVVGMYGATNDLWIYERARGVLTRLAFGWDNEAPIWTPDSARVTFSSNRQGQRNLYWQLADGSEPAERLTTGDHPQQATSWSPDGRILIFQELRPETGNDIWLLPFPEREPKVFLQTAANEGQASISPDGRFIAYVSDESGRPEVYVRPRSGTGRWQISTAGGARPRWAHDGRELFYVQGAAPTGATVMAVRTAAGGSFQASKPAPLFTAQGFVSDVTSDGRFLVAVPDDPPQAAPQFGLMVNWPLELARRAAAR